MVETAAHLVDHVLPPLPVRQWVLSVPKRLRPFLHHNPAIAGAVLRDHASRGALHRHGLLERHVTDDMRTWQASGGFSIDASVHIPARDRAGLERLLRYCARPPFALERLEATGYGAPGGERIVYRLPHPAPDGTTALSLTPLEFLERLALLIHPPRIHRHRYHGVLAPGVPTKGGSKAQVSGHRARA